MPLVYLLIAGWLSVLILRGRLSRRSAYFLFLLSWGVLFFCQALTRSDAYHFAITLPPFFILAAYAGSVSLEGRSRTVRILAGSAASLALISFCWLTRFSTLPDPSDQTEMLALGRGGVLLKGGLGTTDFVRAMQNRAPADRSILCLPYQPMLYFLSERRNPTRWNYLWAGDQTESDHAELIREAKNNSPALVVLTGEEAMTAYASPIVNYVHEDFRLLADYGEVKVYVPR